MIYVDDAVFPWKNYLWCHMFADTNKELHRFATSALGLKRSWFQNHPLLPHYDITASKRALAIKRGAKAVDRYFVVQKIREARDAQSKYKRRA